MIQLHPADVVLVHGNGWPARLIRWATRSTGEAPTWVSHVAMAVDSQFIVEALGRGVVERRLLDAYPTSRVRVFRPLNVPTDTLVYIARAALQHRGQRYGYLKLIPHALDALLGGKVFFRKLISVDDRPVCSWLVGEAYARAGYAFGIDGCYVTPDDIADYVQTHHKHYARVL